MRLGLLGRNYSLTLDLPAPRWLLDVAIECADCAVDEAEVRVLECPKLPELARPPWLVAELDDCVQLAGRLNNLADWELTALRGVFASRHPATMEEVLTMTQGLERVPVVRGIHHLMMVLSALPELKRFLAIWFKAGTTGDQMPDADGAQYVSLE